jgi:hypothetical protein
VRLRYSHTEAARNRHAARLLNEAKLATLLIDLLTLDEEAIDARTAHLRFDIDLLAEGLVGATDWLTQYPDSQYISIGYFGASTGRARAVVETAADKFGWQRRPKLPAGEGYGFAFAQYKNLEV